MSKKKKRVYKKRYYYNGKRCSKGEHAVAVFLSRNNVNFVQEKTFENCVSVKNYPLRFDFYLTDFNICIEYQGEHHYGPVNKYRRAQIAHNKTVKHDRIKKRYALTHGIGLLEIPHWEFDDVDNILYDILEPYIIKDIRST